MKKNLIILLALCSLALAQSDDGSGSVLTDPRDGQSYRAVKIGGVTWMAENLNYAAAAGDSRCYDNDDSNCGKYGRLYDWNTAMTACPEGWRLPAKVEWDALVQAAGGKAAGAQLKAKDGWDNTGNGTDKFGFSALPGGGRFTMDSFSAAGTRGHWWSAAEVGKKDKGSAWGRQMDWGNNTVGEGRGDKRLGFSVRCVQN